MPDVPFTVIEKKAATTRAASGPSLPLAGSVGGGVWKTTNAGRTWKPVFDRQPIGDLMSRMTNDLDSVGQLFDKGLVGSPVESLAQQDQEQRRRVNRPVVGTEWHFTATRHLAATVLMQNLAWLFVAPVVVFLALISRENAQGVDGKLRVQGEGLVGGDD